MPGFDISAQLGEAAWTRADRDGVLRALQRARLDRVALTSRRALAGEVTAGNTELKAALEGQANLAGWVVASPVDVELSTQELSRHAGAPNILGLHIDPRAFGVPLHAESITDIVNG